MDLALESSSEIRYESIGCFQRDSSKSGLINKSSCFLAKTGKLPGAQENLTYRWKALKKLYIYP